MDKKILLTFILMTFVLNIEIVYGSSSISVNDTDTVFDITGENYRVQIGKSSFYGIERNLWVGNINLPYRPYLNSRRIEPENSTGDAYAIFIDTKPLSWTLVENGPSRVVIHGINEISNICWISPEVVCLNYSIDIYLYPEKYFFYYYIWGNFTQLSTGYTGFRPYAFNRFSTTAHNITYWGRGNLTGNLVSSGTIASNPGGGVKDFYLYVWNGTHNATVGWFSTKSDIGDGTPAWRATNDSYFSQFEFSQGGTNKNRKNATLAWLSMFGNSGGGDLDINETINELDFKPQFLDYYYPASITTITGSYQGRDNITSTYDFTVDSSGLLRFNFSSGLYNRTYPVFHIKDTTSTASSYKDHIWYKNYSAVNVWQQLTNYTDFVIQDGNSTYFGYNYILLLINKTLGSDYEFWISNSTEPVYPQYFDSSVNSTLNGTAVEFRLRWTDNVGLSGYIFSFDNCTGTLVNDTFTTMTGTENWSNVTKIINNTLDCTIKWQVYANDTSNNWNASDVYSFTTSLALTTMNLSSYEVWWSDSVTAYGRAFDEEGNPAANTNVNLTISNIRCNNVTDSFGYWQCRFNAPNELGTYTVYAKIGDISINTTSLTVKPKYGKTPIGTIERIVYEEPIMIQEPSGRIRIAWARIMIWRG